MENQIQQIEKLLNIKLEKKDYNSENQVNVYQTWTHLAGIKELQLKHVCIDDISVLLPFSKNLHILKLINCRITNICQIYDFEDLANLTLDTITILNSKELTLKKKNNTSYQGNLQVVNLKNMTIKHLRVLLPMAKHLAYLYLTKCTVHNFYEVNLFTKLYALNLDTVTIHKSNKDFCYPSILNRKFWFLDIKNMAIENINFFLPISETLIDLDIINCTIKSIGELHKFPSLEHLTIDGLTTIEDKNIENTTSSFRVKELVITENHPFNLEKMESIAPYIKKIVFNKYNISGVALIAKFIRLEALHFYNQTVAIKTFLPVADQIKAITFENTIIEDISELKHFKKLKTLKVIGDTPEEGIQDFKRIVCLKKQLEKLELWEDDIKNVVLIKKFRVLKSVYIYKTSGEVAKSVFSLSKLKKLSIGIGAKETQSFQLKKLQNIEELYLSNENNVKIKGLHKLPKLKILSLEDECSIKSLHKIKKLTYLKINNAVNINDIQAIPSLKKLVINANKEYKVLSLERFINLKELFIEGSNNIQLGNLPNLKTLEVSATFLSNINFLDNLPNLEKLSLQNNCLTEIKGLDTLTNLKMLDLSGNSDIENIKELATLKRLEYLNLYENKVSDITILNTLPNLKQVNLAENKIEKKEAISQLQKPEIAIFKELPNIPFRIWKYQDFKL